MVAPVVPSKNSAPLRWSACTPNGRTVSAVSAVSGAPQIKSKRHNRHKSAPGKVEHRVTGGHNDAIELELVAWGDPPPQPQRGTVTVTVGNQGQETDPVAAAGRGVGVEVGVR